MIRLIKQLFCWHKEGNQIPVCIAEPIPRKGGEYKLKEIEKGFFCSKCRKYIKYEWEVTPGGNVALEGWGMQVEWICNFIDWIQKIFYSIKFFKRM